MARNNPLTSLNMFQDDMIRDRIQFHEQHQHHHQQTTIYTCNYCDRPFKHKRSRDRHVKLHTGDKRYKCQHCTCAFSRSDHLKIHLKTHDHRKPFQCTVCNRGYNTAAALTSHMQSHKRPAPSAPTVAYPPLMAEPGAPGQVGAGMGPLVSTQNPPPPMYAPNSMDPVNQQAHYMWLLLCLQQTQRFLQNGIYHDPNFISNYYNQPNL